MDIRIQSIESLPKLIPYFILHTTPLRKIFFMYLIRIWGSLKDEFFHTIVRVTSNLAYFV